MQFLVQRIGGQIVDDFAFVMTQAKRYYEWLGKEELEIDYAAHSASHASSIVGSDRYIPIGSVEFVSEYLRAYYPKAEAALMPLNVPECLFPLAKRQIANVTEWKGGDMLNGKKLFCKSLTMIKHPLNGIGNPSAFTKYGGCQVSEVVDIDSEWRVFVFHNEIQHIANYSGDCMAFPDRSDIEAMVSVYAKEKDVPVAYTLDVGVSSLRTFVIECHRFFSCGLYGYNDLARIPKMFSQCWYEMIKMR